MACLKLVLPILVVTILLQTNAFAQLRVNREMLPKKIVGVFMNVNYAASNKAHDTSGSRSLGEYKAQIYGGNPNLVEGELKRIAIHSSVGVLWGISDSLNLSYSAIYENIKESGSLKQVEDASFDATAIRDNVSAYLVEKFGGSGKASGLVAQNLELLYRPTYENKFGWILFGGLTYSSVKIDLRDAQTPLSDFPLHSLYFGTRMDFYGRVWPVNVVLELTTHGDQAKIGTDYAGNQVRMSRGRGYGGKLGFSYESEFSKNYLRWGFDWSARSLRNIIATDVNLDTASVYHKLNLTLDYYSYKGLQDSSPPTPFIFGGHISNTFQGSNYPKENSAGVYLKIYF